MYVPQVEDFVAATAVVCGPERRARLSIQRDVYQVGNV